MNVSAADALSIDSDIVADLLVGFIAEEARKVGFERVILGLSGGVDSSLTAALAVRALGPEAVICVLMPYRTSSSVSVEHGELLCARLGVQPVKIDITAQIDAYFASFPDAGRARRGNKMARERMTVLYDMSAVHNALVLGTTNKSELLLGYGTVFGDMASALNPIGDLYKTQVFALARSLGLPEEIINKAPSADLWEGQSDEEEIGFAYADVDTLLYYMVDERRTVGELQAMGFSADFIAEIGNRVRLSQYKRRLPLIAKLSVRTVDRDFRYPRDWGH